MRASCASIAATNARSASLSTASSPARPRISTDSTAPLRGLSTLLVRSDAISSAQLQPCSPRRTRAMPRVNGAESLPKCSGPSVAARVVAKKTGSRVDCSSTGSVLSNARRASLKTAGAGTRCGSTVAHPASAASAPSSKLSLKRLLMMRAPPSCRLSLRLRSGLHQRAFALHQGAISRYVLCAQHHRPTRLRSRP